MKRVAIRLDGVRLIHAESHNSVYATFCGLDGDDPAVGQSAADPPKRGEKINCPDCIALWKHARTFKAVDFDFGEAA